MTKIKILFIDCRADLGGGSKHLLGLLNGLDSSRFEIFVAAPKNQALSEKLGIHANDFFTIPFRRFSLRSLWNLKRFAEKHGVHFIHSHGKGAGIYGRLLSYWTEIPVVHTFHGVTEPDKTFKSVISIFIEQLLAKQTSNFIHVSESEREFAWRLKISDPDRSVVILNGVDLTVFSSAANIRAEIRKKFNFSDDHFVIGCVARFDKCKRQEDLILAINRLVLKHPHIRLILVGTGESDRQVKKLLADKALGSYVQTLDSYDCIYDLYQVFDLFVLPSLHEGLPLAPIEAMASGCPVILTDVRGNRDVILNNSTGILVPVRNPGALADQIETLIQNSTLRAKIAGASKLHATEKFDIQRTIRETQEFYLSLCPIPEIKKIALVHDWLFHMRGGEKVLEAIGTLAPMAPIYTLFLSKQKLSSSLKGHRILPSFLNSLPGVGQFYRYLLPLLPSVMQCLNLNKFDLIISSSHCVAKAAPRPKQGKHICYCHAPMRYAWGFSDEYFGEYSKLKRALIGGVTSMLRTWDRNSSQNVDFFIANSQNVRNRIHNFYNRDAAVIYPPISVACKTQVQLAAEDFYLIVSALVPYKRVDIAVQTFRRIQSQLIIVGDGPLLKQLKEQATPNVQFLGWQNDEEVARNYQTCRALIFPTEEDFGMVPVEAMSYGKPVIAFGKGGALETVIPATNAQNSEKSTGVLFDQQSSDSLFDAIREFESYQFDPIFIKRHAHLFSREHFVQQMTDFLKNYGKQS